MQPIRTFLRRCREFLRKDKLDADMTEQIRLHLELTTEKNIAAGMSPYEARYAAMRKFGGVEQVKEVAREQRGWFWLEQLGRDIRFSVRSLRKSPAFSLAVIATLALCIGANTAILSALYTFILKPLPLRAPQELVEVYNTYVKSGDTKNLGSVAQYLDYRENADLFASFSFVGISNFVVGEETEPERVNGRMVTPDFFDLLGVTPLHGRFFGHERAAAEQREVVLTRSFWEKQYRADPDIVGKSIRLTGVLHTVIGVAPRQVESVDVRTAIFSTLGIGTGGQPISTVLSANPQSRLQPNGFIYGRLKPGVTHRAGLAQLDALERRFYQEYANAAVRNNIDTSGHKIALGGLQEEQTRPVRGGLIVLQAGVFFVLLIGCVNVATLLLARSNGRLSELAVRLALGASRGAIARQLLTEAMVLTVAGTAAGLMVALAGLQVVNTYLPRMIVEQARPVTLEGSVLGLMLATSLMVGLVVGCLPVIHVWQRNMLGLIQGGGTRGTSGGVRVRAANSILVTAQVAIALTLLVAAGLLIRSFANIMAIEPGFAAQSIVTGRVALPPANAGPKTPAFRELVSAKFREIPGVEAVGLAGNVVVETGMMPAVPFAIRGRSPEEIGAQPMGNPFPVSPGFFATMAIPLREGRDFSAADAPGKVMVVDRVLAERYFPGRSALGERLALGNSPANEANWPVIIGVVERAWLHGLENRSGLPFIYLPMGLGPNFSVVVRATRAPADVLRDMRQKMREIDPTIPLYLTDSLQSRLDSTVRNRRGTMVLLGALALLAVALSAVGIYGMLAYDVSQRTREIGIRGAIGASRMNILGLILWQGLWKVGMGLAIGLAGAFFVTRFMRSMLYDVQPADPVAYLAVSLLLLFVALVASYLPARRAAKVDPVIALRAE